MTISGIALDEFASGTPLEHLTITIVTLCFLLSFSLFCTRLKQVITSTEEKDKGTFFIQICHLSSMFFSCFYIFLYEWNYIHLYLNYNAMNCTLWFILIMTSLTLSKIFIYSFLMLRSSLSFRQSIFQIPLQISILITIISVTSQLIMMSLMLSDFTTISFPNSSACFRRLGPTATAGITGYNVSDAISNAIALIIFWKKSKSVKNILFGGPNVCNTVNQSTSDINSIFRKHIFLGMLITAGSILIFLAGEFLTILMGVASVLHQLANNIYIFLLFKENQKVYNIICCQCHMAHMRDIVSHLNLPQIQIYGNSNPDKMTNPAKITRNMSDMSSPTFSSKSLSVIPRTILVCRNDIYVQSQSLMDMQKYNGKPLQNNTGVNNEGINRMTMNESTRRSTILSLNTNINKL